MTPDLFTTAGGAADRPILTAVERRLIEAHTAIRAEPPAAVDFLHSVFCQCPLPLRCPGRGRRVWERRQGKACLRLEAGGAFDPRRGGFVEPGLPYGEMPRLLLIFLIGEAVRAQSPAIEVADSMTAFMRSIGLDTGGRARGRFKDQLARLAAATVRVALTEGAFARHYAARFIAGFDLWFPKDAKQRVLWPSAVELSAEFFASLLEHAVPLDRRAVAALRHSALLLDVYVWLAQRLWRVAAARPVVVPWPRLREQFGPHYRRLADFRRTFLPALARVQLAYPEARLAADGRGLVLRASPPPVARRRYPVAAPAARALWANGLSTGPCSHPGGSLLHP